ncbi:hypothetical protein Dimus_011506 [Dionaea muscipula]
MAGHSLARCFKANPNKPACSHYKMPKCFKLHGYPSSKKSDGRNQATAFVASSREHVSGSQVSSTQLMALPQSYRLFNHPPIMSKPLYVRILLMVICPPFLVFIFAFLFSALKLLIILLHHGF